MDKVRLSTLLRGQSGRVVSIEKEELVFGLLSMGLFAGDLFTVRDIAPLGGPLSIEVNDTKIALRREDAANIWVTLKK